MKKVLVVAGAFGALASVLFGLAVLFRRIRPMLEDEFDDTPIDELLED